MEVERGARRALDPSGTAGFPLFSSLSLGGALLLCGEGWQRRWTQREGVRAVGVPRALKKKGTEARVVSLPCFEVFRQQSDDYRLSVLPDGHPILSIEAYSSFGWGEFAHSHCAINTFGASAPAKAVYKKFGLTGADVSARAEKTIAHYKKLGIPVYSPVSTQLSV
ncbi:hypothetical protein JCM6882_006939 [Rhodosporidiobolus microsporus]